MDAEQLGDRVGKWQARGWYDGLVEEYGWNARFWEQRALAEARCGQFSKARSFAEEALRIRSDPFTLTTLGSILLRMAGDQFEQGSVESDQVFWEGVALLRQAREALSPALHSAPGHHIFLVYTGHLLISAQLLFYDF